MSAMDPVIIIEVIHGSQEIANYTLDGYLCHIAIPAHAQLPKMDCPVRYDQGNYAVLHYIHNVRLVLYIQLGNLTSLYKDTLWSNCEESQLLVVESLLSSPFLNNYE